MNANRRDLSILVASLIALLCGCSTTPIQAPTDGTNAIHNQWTWVSGANTSGQAAVYGVQGIAAASNTPGERVDAVTWIDKNGNFWLFGGFWGGSLLQNYFLNDLWKYNGGQWTWVSGSNTPNASGVYGTLGVAAASNVPGARSRAVSWTDAQGNLWLFGGVGMDVSAVQGIIYGGQGELNDLWKFSGGLWTWVSGSNVKNQPGVYGTQGVPSASNIPGGRDGAASWTDAQGNLWLFSGVASNDLWKYSNGQWTWMAGPNGAASNANYGTQGIAAPSNIPGNRSGAATWVDASGNLWLFGGVGSGTPVSSPYSNYGTLNDLWKYSNGQWTWMAGSTSPNQSGVYGVQGTAAVGNIPGARSGSVSWIDTAGSFWLYGGLEPGADNNELWKYSNGLWTWVSGISTSQQSGTYGIQGTASAANNPGARDGAASWVDSSGNLWLFGGSIENIYSQLPGNLMYYGRPSVYFSDLWKYQP